MVVEIEAHQSRHSVRRRLCSTAGGVALKPCARAGLKPAVEMLLVKPWRERFVQAVQNQKQPAAALINSIKAALS